jgi:hypothetical protein
VPVGLSYTTADLGEAYLLAGRVGDASSTGRRAIDLSRRHKERGWEARALLLWGMIATDPQSGDVSTADAYYLESMSLAKELGMRPLVAHCHLGLGKLYRHTGKRQEAHEHLTIGTAMYREMDMRFWLQQAEAETKELT